MACEGWNEAMVARLYDELAGPEAAALERHLEACARCRATSAELADARALLREGAGEIPRSAPIVVLGEGPARSRLARWWPAAAACAAVVIAAIALGVALDAGRAASGGASPAATPFDPAELEHSLAERVDTRVDSAVREATADLATRDEVDERIEALRLALTRQRRDDVDLLLAEIAASELRSGAALHATRRTFEYYALANNPGITEW